MSDLQKQDLEFWKECYCIALKGLTKEPEASAEAQLGLSKLPKTQQAENIANNSLMRLWKKRDELDNR